MTMPSPPLMDPADLDIRSALAAQREGTLTSCDLTAACLARIEARNDTYRAFIAMTGSEAMAAAAAADHARGRGEWLGPLHGIPMSLKDLVDQRGVPTTAGSHVTPRTPASADAPVTARLRRAGAVLVGKCNLHEFAFGTTSEESAFGAARNPTDPSRSPGGSSGGSAIAVATGMSLASIGTDTGGSIRIPAAACGIVGLKPGLGEISCDGVVPLSRTLDHVGPLAKTVADAAVVYSAVTGDGVPGLERPRPINGIRIGVLGGYFTARLEPDIAALVDAARERLAAAGVSLEEVALAHADTIAPVYLTIVLAEAAVYHGETLERMPERYSPGVRQRLEAGRYVLAEDYLRALRGRDVLRAIVDGALGAYDALLAPTLPIEAPVIGTPAVTIDGVAEPVRNLMLRLTQPFNVTGHPAISIPCGTTTAGLPAGLQLVGKHGLTPELLSIALACEPYIRGESPA